MVYGYRWNRSQEAKSELIKRNVFTGDEWAKIERREVSIGMSECAMRAAFAIDYKRIVVTTSKKTGDKTLSFIYSCKDKRTPYCPYTRVDVADGIVTGVYQVDKLK